MPNEPRFLIIDPQRAFHPAKGKSQEEDGPLAVKGANEDSERIIEMLKANSGAEVYVSLDSHTIKHIGHYGFWKRTNVDEKEGDSVESLQGNQIHYLHRFGREGLLFIQPPGKDEDGVYIKPPKVYIEARDQAMRKYAIKYVKKLQEDRDAKKLGKVPMLWRTHCIITDPKADKDEQKDQTLTGRAIYAPLFEALKDRKKVKYYKKGENEDTEMYSIFKSELDPSSEELDDTRARLGRFYPKEYGHTGELSVDEISLIQKGSSEFEPVLENIPYLVYEFNDNPGSLYSELTKGAKSTNPVDIYICGQALSHCVNYSLRDLVEKLRNDNQQHVKVHLVLNCSSTVVLTGIDSAFFGNSVQLIRDILGEYNKYCDIVFWNGSDVVPSEYTVKKTTDVFNAMAVTYDEGKYQAYLESKDIIRGIGDAFEGKVTLTPEAEAAAAKEAAAAAKEAAAAAKAAAEEADEEPVEKGKSGILSGLFGRSKKKREAVKGGKRTKKKRHSKTQKKRKGQIKNSKRHRRSRK